MKIELKIPTMEDKDELKAVCNAVDKNYLSDRLSYPYTDESAEWWINIPGQFKAFIDRCTPWCNTHEPHASIKPGKKGYAIALRTGPNMPECDRIIGNIEHFYGHLEIESVVLMSRAGS